MAHHDHETVKGRVTDLVGNTKGFAVRARRSGRPPKDDEIPGSMHRDHVCCGKQLPNRRVANHQRPGT